MSNGNGKPQLFANGNHVVIILAVSAVVTLAWGLTRPMTFGGDSTTYIQLAEFLLGQGIPHPVVFVRPPGYPLLLIATGVPIFNSFAGILAVQALMAFLIPVICYRAVAYFSEPAGFAAGLLITLTLMPQIHSREIMTEQVFIFFFCVLAWLVVKFWIERSARVFWWMVLTCLALTLIRPSANFIGYIVLLLVIALGRKHVRQALQGAALIFGVTTVWSVVIAIYAMPSQLYAIPPQTSFSDRLTLAGFTYLMEHNQERPSDGRFTSAAGQELRRAVAHLVYARPEVWRDREPARYYSTYRQSPGEFEQVLLSSNNRHHIRLLVEAMNLAWADRVVGRNPTQLQVAFVADQFVRSPNLFLSFIIQCLSGSTISFAGQALFYDGFAQGRFAVPPNTSVDQLVFSANNGPASRRLLEIVTSFAEDYPGFWQHHPLAGFGSDPRSFVEGLRTHPSDISWTFLWHATDFVVGQAESARLFRAAALENIAARPTIVLTLLDNLVSVLFGPTAAYTGGERRISLPTISSVTFPDPGLKQALRVKVQPNVLLPQFTALWESPIVNYSYGFAHSALKLLLSITIVATLLFVLVSPIWWPGAVLALALFYHHALTAVFAENYPRYIDQVFPVTVVLAAIGIAAARRGIVALKEQRENMRVNKDQVVPTSA